MKLGYIHTNKDEQAKVLQVMKMLSELLLSGKSCNFAHRCRFRYTQLQRAADSTKRTSRFLPQ